MRSHIPYMNPMVSEGLICPSVCFLPSFKASAERLQRSRNAVGTAPRRCLHRLFDKVCCCQKCTRISDIFQWIAKNHLSDPTFYVIILDHKTFKKQVGNKQLPLISPQNAILYEQFATQENTFGKRQFSKAQRFDFQRPKAKGPPAFPAGRIRLAYSSWPAGHGLVTGHVAFLIPYQETKTVGNQTFWTCWVSIIHIRFYITLNFYQKNTAHNTQHESYRFMRLHVYAIYIIYTVYII